MNTSTIIKPLLSVAIITFNEERIIEETLSAIDNWVDQIVVVDSFSTDKTLSILEIFNVNLFQKKWEGYSKQKNFALSKCTGDWVLMLDADEVVSPLLKDEILNVIKNPGLNCGCKAKRKFYLGIRWIRYGGYYPDYQSRLFKSNINAHFNEREVHESVVLEKPLGYLNNSLDHYAYSNLNEYKSTLKKYAMLASKEIKAKKFYVPLLRAIWAFMFRYIFRLGFLEGKYGYRLCKIYSLYVFEKYNTARTTKTNSKLKVKS